MLHLAAAIVTIALAAFGGGVIADTFVDRGDAIVAALRMERR